LSSEEAVLQPDLSSRVALVTGASRGIGRAIARSLAGCGASVVAVARNTERLAAVCREIVAAGGNAIPAAADVSREVDVLRAFTLLDESFGGRLDILVNNAGIGLFGSVEEFAADAWDQVMAVNLRSAFLCSREAVRRMRPGGRGYIINVASVVGLKGYVDQGAYAASKHGVVGLTKTLAAELHGQGIKVSAICPGGVDTELIGRARPDLNRGELMQPADIAQTVLYLLSLPARATVDMIYIRRSGSTPF
jgi:3-oxoacyl-[acyl-carrier protein] reductase